MIFVTRNKMKYNYLLLLCLLLEIGLSLGSDCNLHSSASSSSLCSKIDKNRFKHIRQWWESVSAPKPIKCNRIRHKKENIEESVWKLFENVKVVTSLPCQPGEIGLPYETRGKGLKVVDGRLEGAGKLIITKSWQENGDVVQISLTCLRIRKDVNGVSPEEIVGTFVNGNLEGNAKIKLSDNSLVIAQFKDGVFDGFFREWNSDGNLIRLGNYYKDTMVSYCWNVFKGFLMYLDCSSVDRPDVSTTLFISINKSDEFAIAGNLNPISMSLGNASEVSFDHMSPVDDCLLQLEYQLTERVDPRLSFSTGIRQSIAYDPTKTLCHTHTGNSSRNGSEQLSDWIEGLIEQMKAEPFTTVTRLKPAEEELDKDKALVLVPEVRLSSDGQNVSKRLNISILGGKPTAFVLAVINLDISNRCHGYCELHLDQTGIPEDVGSDPTLGWRPIRIKGNFVHGFLNGHCAVDIKDHRWVLGNAVDGVLHGPLVVGGVVQILPGRPVLKEMKSHMGIGFLGHYINGRATGDFWIGMKGYGHLHGQVHSSNQSVTGDRIAYIYPDHETVLLGKFENIFMRSAQESTVLEVGCNTNGLMVVKKNSEPSGPFFYYEAPTNVSMGAGPPGVMDPYEKKGLKLGKSQIENSGEGIFSQRAVPSERVIAFMCGLFYDTPEQIQIYKESCIENTSKSDEYRRACKKYSIGLLTYKTTVQIPPELDASGEFFPALGQKVNHHFLLNNTVFGEMEHPRWGTVPSVQTSRPIKAGEEIFAFYGYSQALFPEDFPWYWETKLVAEKEERMMQQKLKLKEKEKQKGNKQN